MSEPLEAEPVATLQRTLDAEHATLRVLGVAAARTSRGAAPELAVRLDEAHRVHRLRRDAWEGWLRTLGAEPAPAAPEYRSPEGADAVAVAVAVESACLEHYAALVAVSADELRSAATEALTESALALVAWGDAPRPFPGAPELDR